MFRKLLRTPVLMIFAFGCFAQALAPSPSVPPVAGSSVSSVEAAIPSDAAVAPSPSAPANSAPQWNNSLGEAKALYRKGDFAGAIARYQAILQEKPKLPDAIAGLIRVYLKQKNLELAAKTADQALQASESPRVRTAHAEVLFRQGRIDSAEKEWVDVINSGSPEARAYLGVARVRRAIAMYKSAETMINKAHELDPADPDIQEDWVASLPRAQRIKYLEESLAGENNWDADERTDTANYLEYLKERTKLNGRSCRLVSKVTATETPLVRLLSDPKHLRGYGLTVVLNDHKTNLLLDTGANGILVKRSVAEKAGISKVTATKIGGIGSRGRRNGYVGIVESNSPSRMRKKIPLTRNSQNPVKRPSRQIRIRFRPLHACRDGKIAILLPTCNRIPAFFALVTICWSPPRSAKYLANSLSWIPDRSRTLFRRRQLERSRKWDSIPTREWKA
jgi:tetratricopeptide (TPR) repeat protein